ncbi:MAG: RNB domain-containing ribonuclease [Steroidobacteraceae bacterium]
MIGTVELRRIARRAMLERGLLPDFSPEAMRQAAAIRPAHAPPASPSSGSGGTAAHGDGAAVRDRRGLLWSSIDNDDSRDLDQIEVVEPLTGGAARVLIGIADVDALVGRDSPIDAHARQNTTSVYTAAQIFPMLPESLSTDLTSLAPDADRLALVVELTVSAEGAVTDAEVYPAWVRNHAQLAYDSVGAWLAGGSAPPPRVASVPGLAEQLRRQDEIASRLKSLRRTHGALDLETGEARAVFEGGVLTDLRPEQKNRAKEIIEDFMIAANGAIARFLGTSGFPSLRRVLRAPERWSRIAALAASLGQSLPDTPDALALDAFLRSRRAADPARFADLSLAVVKLLGRGEYVAERPSARGPGHFALAVLDYAHSTAPNRRFPDLITHRLLKAALAGRPPPYRPEELEALAAHCTEQEANAAKVERRVRKSAAALLLTPRIGERFQAVVSGVNEDGVWVRIARPMAEGKLVRGSEALDVGDCIEVELVQADVERGFVDFARSR